MNDSLDVNPDVGVLEACDALAAAMAMRKERERVARDLIEDGVVVSAREGHGGESTGHRTEGNALPNRQIHQIRPASAWTADWIAGRQ
jgi:hypothetical protein